jgi:hypothetical protein
MPLGFDIMDPGTPDQPLPPSHIGFLINDIVVGSLPH